MFNSNLIGGISGKRQGNMRVFLIGAHPETQHNREVFFSPFNKKVIAADLVHGRRVVVVDDSSADIVSTCDALITASPKLMLSITVADCLPVYFYDPKKKVLGLAHAGWRGVEANIVSEVVLSLKKNYGSDQSDLEVYIGPHIGVCHFEVGEEVAVKFSAYPEAILRRDGKIYIDLAKIVRVQLLAASVREKNIELSSECTYCTCDKYFSYRRDNPGLDKLEVMVAYLGLK